MHFPIPLRPDFNRYISRRNALWLVEHLLECTPRLMDDLVAEPGMLRGLLGFWAEDEFGHDCGAEVSCPSCY